MRLVADLGGTNVRFGTLASGRAEPDRVSRFSNDDFGGFAAALERYWASIGRPGIDEAVIAVAGPVTGRKARLTNRDWQVDADEISELLGGAGVVLLNDLNALGHAVPHLGAGDVAVICAHQGDAVPMQQALVVGIGTGFNVSPVLVVGGRVFAQAAEFGHAQLPAGYLT